MSAWLFGKLPAHGDFVSRGLTPDARDALDDWLARSLADARAAHGDRFDDRYEEAPPWRFAWAEPAGWVAGALALSVDAVGRRYPILLAQGELAGEQVEHSADLAENLLYEALAGGWDADRLQAAAADAAPEAGETWTGDEGWWTLRAERFTEASLVGARPPELITAMLTPTTGEPDDA